MDADKAVMSRFAAPDKIGVFTDGIWYLDMNNNWQWDGEPTDTYGVFGIGVPNAVPVTGRW